VPLSNRILICEPDRFAAFSVTISKLSDIYGRRNLLVVSWIMFSAFSILCAMARTMQQL
jgi:MFS family permease